MLLYGCSELWYWEYTTIRKPDMLDILPVQQKAIEWLEVKKIDPYMRPRRDFEVTGLSPWGVPPEIWNDPRFFKMWQDIQEQLIGVGFSWAVASRMAAIVVMQVVEKLGGVAAALAGGTSAVVIALAVGAALVLVAIGIFIWINPSIESSVVKKYPGYRYVMRYKERFWWADLVGCTLKGRNLYMKCEEVPGKIVEDSGKIWKFNNTWFEQYRRGLLYYTNVYQLAYVRFVCFLEHGGGTHYYIQKGYHDGIAGDVRPGWTSEVALWCDEPVHDVIYW